MFCPTCGAKSPDDHRFCRSCGTDLGLVSKALSGELLDPRKAEIERAYQGALFRGAVSVLILILALLAAVKVVVGEIDRDAFGPFLLVLSWIAVALLFANLFFARRRRKVRRQLLEKGPGLAARRKGTAPLPARRPASPPSVREHATPRLSQDVPIKERLREYE